MLNSTSIGIKNRAQPLQHDKRIFKLTKIIKPLGVLVLVPLIVAFLLWAALSSTGNESAQSTVCDNSTPWVLNTLMVKQDGPT
jgi:hypothetical protein